MHNLKQRGIGFYNSKQWQLVGGAEDYFRASVQPFAAKISQQDISPSRYRVVSSDFDIRITIRKVRSKRYIFNFNCPRFFDSIPRQVYRRNFNAHQLDRIVGSVLPAARPPG